MARGKLQAVCRRKILNPQEVGKLKRCLNYWDVTSLGLGSTLGAGVYVLVGAVAYTFAGPSVLLSFILAALAALFAGLCYAELVARMPMAGSVYVYTYAAVGQLAAFLVGWISVLEFVFGAASISRGLSLYIDMMADRAISTWFVDTMPITPAVLSSHFDLLAFAFTLALGVILVFSVRQSITVNNVFSICNLAVIIFIIIAGAIQANTANWSVSDAEVPVDSGTGGFFPHSVWGTLKGAAVCFYGFAGFNVINYSAEEVRDPRRTIPLSILTSLLVIFTIYAAVSIVLTMMVPYYQLEGLTSLAAAFNLVGLEWARWVVIAGAIFGMFSSLFGSLYPLPRLLYSMASDGLFFHWFGSISDWNQTPLVATVIPTLIIASLSAIIKLEQLVLLMCFGTLVSFTVAACCVLLLRYRSDIVLESSPGIFRQIFGYGDRLATSRTFNLIVMTLLLYISLCISIGAVHTYMARPLIPAVVLHAFGIFLIIVIFLQPKAKEDLDFKAPLVPFVPCLSIYANINLLIAINYETWILVAGWILIGIPIYLICLCCYKQDLSDYDRNYINKNGKPPVLIVVESPTPPATITQTSNRGDQAQNEDIQMQQVQDNDVRPYNEETPVQVVVDHNEEKEAKIIDLLDQVLQAEEDSYGEIISLKENKESKDMIVTENDPIIHRKSLSELSDAGSDASLGNQVLSKYDVIAQVHQEDLPKVNEEDEKVDDDENISNDDYEQVTAFNDSDTNSRTDESGYSDTIDRTPLNVSIDDTKETCSIPVPPPMDEDYFKPTNYKKFNTVPAKHHKPDAGDDDEEFNHPRESVTSNKSNSSYGDGNMRFGSDRQIKFMSKLNDIFQNKIGSDDEEPRKRSHSTGTIPDAELTVIPERPSIFLDLKKELLSREPAQNLRPVNIEEKTAEEKIEPQDPTEAQLVEDASMSRQELKSKLENIFAIGGPQLLKPRLMKSNPPTPDESYQTDASSTESIPKLPKMEKNDTLKRQKAKFGDVLNSFRLSMNKDDDV